MDNWHTKTNFGGIFISSIQAVFYYHSISILRHLINVGMQILAVAVAVFLKGKCQPRFVRLSSPPPPRARALRQSSENTCL